MVGVRADIETARAIVVESDGEEVGRQVTMVLIFTLPRRTLPLEDGHTQKPLARDIVAPSHEHLESSSVL